MFRNYIRIAFRNLWKNRFLSTVNVLGLSVGISAALVIWMIVYYDLSFDLHHQDGERIYRVTSTLDFGDMQIKTPGVPVPMRKALENDATGLETIALLYQYSPGVKAGNEKFGEHKDIAFTEPSYFDVIRYKWLQGSPQVLKNPSQVVLTNRRAQTYFPGKALPDIIGKELVYDDSVHVTVAGIVEAFEGRTDFQLQEFISLKTVESDQGLMSMRGWDQWSNTNSSTNVFVKLAPGITAARLNSQLARIRQKYQGENDFKSTYNVQRLRDIHFMEDFDMFDQRQANLPVLYKLSALVVFLLLLGGINFVNLQTAQASERAREIGIRKTLGSSRGKLILQFLGESFILTGLAACLAILFVPGILIAFSGFIPEGVTMDLLKEWQVFLFIPLLVILISVAAGIYPAFVLARFQPVLVLKNQVHGFRSKTRLRQVLTVSQFCIALVLIMATIIVGQQMRYAFRKTLGFEKTARLNIYSPGWKSNTNTLKEKISHFTEVEQLSQATAAPAAPGSNTTTMSLGTGAMAGDNMVEIKYADTAFLSVYKLKLLAGRNLLPSDTVRELLINATYAHKAGFKRPQDAVGQMLTINNVRKPVVGVLADFHSKGMQEAIKPMAIAAGKTASRGLHIALRRDADMPKTLEKIKAVWTELYPNSPFNYTILDQSIERFYDTEKRLIELLSWATGVAIFISCLGLLGLAVYATRQRTKEIGIRKVLGASIGSIVVLFSKDVARLVMIALIIASFIAWYAMRSWLNNFAYHIPIPWWVFPVAGAAALLLALTTVAVQAIKAAVADPVKSLKSE